MSVLLLSRCPWSRLAASRNFSFPGCTVDILLPMPGIRRLLKGSRAAMGGKAFVKSVSCAVVSPGYNGYHPSIPTSGLPPPSPVGDFCLRFQDETVQLNV